MPLRTALATLALVATLACVTEQPLTHVDGLGSIAFPTSGSADAQPHFIRGVLLMHSFEYEDAATHFRTARELDPSFVMAYWGEAMTHVHAVWNEKDVSAAREVLSTLGTTREERLAQASTERERMYIEAADVMYYGEGEKAALDTAYSRVMERIVSEYPEDDEAKAFYALSLLGLSQGERNVPTYMRAGAIALELFERNPGHPGAAHYAIHSFDDPTHAPLGLKAARAYGPIAPTAGHAQHMTTHIFLALGIWDDLIAANERAVGVVNASLMERFGVTSSCGHYNQWLQYGYQQQGRNDDAGMLLAGCHQNALDRDRGTRGGAANSFAQMRAHFLVDTELWDSPAVTAAVDSMDLTELGKNRIDFGTAYAAIKQGDHATAEAALAAMRSRVAGVDDWGYEYAPIHDGVIAALLERDAGNLTGAIQAAQDAAEYEAALPFDFGPPLAIKPPRELEAELLLESGRTAEALSAYETQLGRTPGRARTLLGYERASAAFGR